MPRKKKSELEPIDELVEDIFSDETEEEYSGMVVEMVVEEKKPQSKRTGVVHAVRVNSIFVRNDGGTLTWIPREKGVAYKVGEVILY